MKVKIYINWFNREVINEKEFEKKVEETTQDYKEDKCFFDEWLNDHYSANEVWNLNEEERKEVQKDFLIKCEELGVRDVREDWEEEEIEV